MATLVLSTVGSALGGPVGGAIGALIGQSFDRQLLGPATQGPRLGGLSVQSSSYGTQIPRVYGSMRVAGSVVWATDLIESEQTGGAKDQPDSSYSYSVSLAVALSSRRAIRVGRIWADGQLLRGAEGDFKVPVTFRFYDGSESQPIDAFIASVEGAANTPGYRGLALAVFENLELATYGNRIPFLTFEVIADEGSTSVGAVLADASEGLVSADAGDSIHGYAAYGRSIGDAIDPLVSTFGVQLFDNGATLRIPAAGLRVDVASEELGSSSDGSASAAVERQRAATNAGPSTLRLSYYDPLRDYQSGEARAAASDVLGNEVRRELPAVIEAGDAKVIAHRMISRAWLGLDRLTLRLPPRYLGIEPGTAVHSAAASGSWTIEKTTLDGFVTVAELTRRGPALPCLAADPGRSVFAKDAVRTPMTLALIEVPDLTQSGQAMPTLLVAASSTGAWRREAIAVDAGGTTMSATIPRKSILGTAENIAGRGSAYLIDETSWIDVALIDADQWLTSCDDAALGAGANLAMIGSEVIQFGTATPLGGGTFRLGRLLRGRGGTDWAIDGHAVGEIFCMLDPASLCAFEIPAGSIGTMVKVADGYGARSEAMFAGEWVRPLSPVNLKATGDATIGLTVTWTRRSRLGMQWLDGVDAPLSESHETYRVKCSTASREFERVCGAAATAFSPEDLAPLGAGDALIEVRQVGDWAVSRPASITIQL